MRPVRIPRPMLVAAGALVCALALGACQETTTPDAYGRLDTDDYRKNHPIIVQEGEETLDIAVGYGTGGLSSSDRDRVAQFARGARERGTGPLVVLAPSGSGNAGAATYVADEARKVARSSGLPDSLIVAQAYDAGGAPEAPVRLSYSRIKAQTGPCGRWSENLARGWQNTTDSEFGCATQANLATMVADPSDLIAPRATTPASGARRAAVLDAWSQGQPTATSYGDDGAGDVTGGGR